MFFDCPIKAEYFKNKVRRLVKRNARLAFERTKRWVKDKFPEFLAGIVVSVKGIVFSVSELAESMGRGIVEQGQKALKNLGKKFEEIAANQGGVVGTILHGADGLNVLRDHFIAVCIIITLIILASYYDFSGSKPRIRVRGSPSKRKARREQSSLNK